MRRTLLARLVGLAGAGVAAAVLLAVRSAFLVVTVEGVSMLPRYRSGDRVLVLRRGWSRLWLRRPLRAGDVVVCRRPPVPDDHPLHVLDGEPGLLVKLVAAVGGEPYPVGSGTVPPGHLFVIGTAAESFDSRAFGPITQGNVVGVVARSMSRRPTG